MPSSACPEKYVLAALLVLTPASARAAGFALQENSAVNMGSAYAGAVANPVDAGTISDNPAGMTQLKSAQAIAGASLISPDVRFGNTNSTVTTPASGGPVASGGGNGGNPFDPALVPYAYLAAPLMGGDLWAGLGVTEPFGLDDNYGSQWAGRYDSVKSELRVVDIAPSAAFRVSPRLSIGAGLDIQYADATLINAVPDPAAAAPSSATDGQADLAGSAWSVGYNIGVLATPAPGLRLGADYHSATSPDLKGRLLTTLPASLGGGTVRQDAAASLKLPDRLSAGLAWDADKDWTLMATGTWFDWSRFNELRATFPDGSPDQVLPQNYRDTWSAAAGAEYKFNPGLTLRGGFQYDQTPTTGAFRDTIVPDADRYNIALGFSQRLGGGFTLDFSAMHTIMADTNINLTGAAQKNFTALGSSATVVGSNRGSADLAALSLRADF